MSQSTLELIKKRRAMLQASNAADIEQPNVSRGTNVDFVKERRARLDNERNAQAQHEQLISNMRAENMERYKKEQEQKTAAPQQSSEARIKNKLDAVLQSNTAPQPTASRYTAGGIAQERARMLADGYARDADKRRQNVLDAQKRKAINARLDEASAAGQTSQKDATWYDATVNSVAQGYDAADLGLERYKLMFGKPNRAAEMEAQIAENYDYSAKGFKGAVANAAQLLGQMANQATNKRTVAMGAAGASAAAIGGKMGPQIAMPEELVTVPAAYIAGSAAGSAMANMESEAGNAYAEMIADGIAPTLARNIAMGVGGMNAGLEMLQIDDLVRGFKAVAKGGETAFSKKLKRIITDKALSVAGNTAQEVLQEGATIGGANLAKGIEGKPLDEAAAVADRLKDTAVSSALSFGLLNVPGTVNNIIGAKHEQGKLQAQSPITQDKAIQGAPQAAQSPIAQDVRQEVQEKLAGGTQQGGTAKVVADLSLFDKNVLSDFNAARKNVIEYAKTHFPDRVTNKATQKVIGISRQGMDKLLSGNLLPAKYASTFHVPELIENAEYVASADNTKPKQGVNGYSYYDSPIS
ncbi:MAG: hypothetical protein RR576_11575, partial [Oscillospiraceae bacterium]